MRVVELIAWGTTTESGLAHDDIRALSASAAVAVSPGWMPGTWELRAGPQVGVISFGDIEVHIRPRISIARLIYLLGYVHDQEFWNDDPVGLHGTSDLVTAMAQTFLRQAEKATQRGVLQGYRTEEAPSPVMRGRLREADQLRLRGGLAMPLEVRYDEYDANIAENQILRAAAERLLQLPDMRSPITRRLRHLIGRLSDARRLVRGERLPHVTTTRLNQHYQPALGLASMILASRSIDIGQADVQATGFLVNMNTAFEDFVTVALIRALAPYGGRCAAQDNRHHMDEAMDIDLRPDLVRYGPSGATRAVVDAKYKAEAPSGFPNADLYQMLAYCTATHLREGHLVYAEGSKNLKDLVVRNSGVVIRRHVLDLQQTVIGLQVQIALLARMIAQPSL